MQDSLEQQTFADATQAPAAVAVQSRADHGARETVLCDTPAILAFNRQPVQAQPLTLEMRQPMTTTPQADLGVLTVHQFRAMQAFAAALEMTAARCRAARTRDDAAAVFKEIDMLVDDQMAMRGETPAGGAR